MPHSKRTATGVLGGFAGLIGLSAVAGLLVTAAVTPAIALSGSAASNAISIFDNMPSILKIDKLMLPSTFTYTNPDTGEDVVLTQFYDQNRSPVDFNEVAPVMYDAMLSSEDPRYYQHGGVDLIGTTRALLQNARGGATQGGSSISQQYVKNILVQKCEADAETDDERGNCFDAATEAEGVEGYQRKLQEMRYAIQLDKEYSKNDILLGYLNIANFGGTNYGVDAAAKYYFSVPASSLSLSQAATLAGVVQNPNTYRIDRLEGSTTNSDGVPVNKAPDGSLDDTPPGVLAALNSLLTSGEITAEQHLAAGDGYSLTKGRQLYVLSRLLDDGKITRDQYVAAAIEPISPAITEPSTGCVAAGGMAYFCQYVLSVVKNDPAFGATEDDRLETLKRGGLTIHTTLDPRVQIPAMDAMNEYTPSSMPDTRYGATAVSVDNTNGHILSIAQNTRFSEDADLLAVDPNYTPIVYAGNPTFGSSRGFSAGSTFKLFTLIDWLEKGHSVNEAVNGRDVAIRRFTNSCTGDITGNTWKATNFDRSGGYTGTPMQFTASSLNSGFVAMAAQLDLCDIGKVAAKLGVVGSDGQPIQTSYPTQVIGPDAVSPLAMAGAYGTVANKGIYCQPQAIARVTDSDGVDRPEMVPQRTCTQVISPEVAATAAYALQGVMNGGTGARANPDNAPVIGKTGTHEEYQTWMIESSTKVATAVWAGNADGFLEVFENSYNGYELSDIRYFIAGDIQWSANRFYGGDDFPRPADNLVRRILTDLPNVVGQSIDSATRTLENAGFEVNVGDPVDSPESEGVVAAQSPGGGRAAAGTLVTISPSNGNGGTVPDVAGQSLEAAVATLRSAGFNNVGAGTCTADETANPVARVASGTNPPAGTSTSRNSTVAIDYTTRTCP